MTTTWNVPYVGQVGDGANEHGNDCGPTCVAQLLDFLKIERPTVDSLFNEVQPSGDSYRSYSDLFLLLDKRGVDADYHVGVSNVQLYEFLILGLPVIALIHYDSLESIRPNKFDGSHFVVVTGQDLDSVYINDPLNTPTKGEGIRVPFSIWDKAWSTVGDGNPQRSLLVPKRNVNQINVLRTVYPKDWNGCNIQPSPGLAGTANRLYGIPYDPTFTKISSKMQIYEIVVLNRPYDKNWGRIHPTEQRWVCLDYTIA